MKRASSRRTYVRAAEIGALLAAITGAEVGGLLPVRLSEIQPHPFWLPILLAAVLYGRFAGILTVAVSTAIQAYLEWPSLVSHPDLYAYLVASSRDPILWLLAVSVLGGIRDRQHEQLRDTEAVMQQRTIEAQALAQRCQVLGREVSLLEHRIAASGASAAGATLQTLDRLLALPVEQTFEAFAHALHRLIGAKGVNVYFPDGENWISAISPAENEKVDGHADEATAQICRRVAGAGRALSCFRETDMRLLEGRAAMGAAFKTTGNRFLCVVLIREVDPACLTPAGEAALSLTSYILGSRAVLDTPPALEAPTEHSLLRHARKPALRVVNNETAR